MKKLFLLATLLCVAVANAQIKIDVDQTFLLGKVKKVTEYNSFVVDGDFHAVEQRRVPPTTIKVYDYDKNGFLVQESTYSQYGDLKVSYGYKVNNKGIIKKHWVKLPDGKKRNFADHKYNDKNQRIEINYYAKENKLTDVCKYDYNDKGLVYKVTYSGEIQPEPVFTEYIYNDKSQLEKVLNYKKDNTKYTSRLYTYYDNGLIKNFIIYDSKGTQQNIISRVYKDFDEQGNWKTRDSKNNKVKNKITRTVRIIEYYK